MKEEKLQLTPQKQRNHKRFLWKITHQQNGNLEEMDKFLEKYSLPRLNQKEWRDQLSVIKLNQLNQQ